MKKQIALLLTVGLLAMTGCQNSQGATSNSSSSESSSSEAVKNTISVTHYSGVTEVPLNPEKIAVLDLAALDTIDALGLGDKVVGIPKQSSVSYLKSYIESDDIAHLGSLKEIDMEKLNSLQPDLIIIGGRLASEYDNIKKIAPTICLRVDHEGGYMNSVESNVLALASVFEKTDEAKGLLGRFSARIENLKSASAGSNAIVGLVTSSSFNTLGNGSRCSLITNEIGFENLGSDVNSTHGDSASFELILEKNPEYIFVLDRDTAISAEGALIAKEVMENEIIMKTTAYQNGNIIYLTPDVWYISEGGITATDKMLVDLENVILK